MVKVYFNPDYMLASPMTSEIIKVEHLQHIADVDVPDLRTAFELCQNSDLPWTELPEVLPVAAVAGGTRSLAPGDVLELDGEWYLIASNDFQKI
jgi:hypothetical protein